MWSLDKPTETATNTFTVCIDRIRDTTLKARLQGCSDSISAAEAAYEARAAVNQLYLVAGTNSVGAASKAEMVAVYDYRMAAKAGPGRPIYDRLKVVPHDRCPYCAHRDVSTLDHFLDKAVHPALAVTPINLVPSCIECNKAKSGKLPIAAENVLFHPYYDDFGPVTWLCAQVVDSTPAAIVFSVSDVSEWNAEMASRAHNHFETFQLGSLYSIQAAREISLIRRNMAIQHELGGADQVRTELERQFISRASVNMNSWQAATYRALAESAWYCAGGFR